MAAENVYVIALSPSEARSWAAMVRKGPNVKVIHPDSPIPLQGLYFSEADDAIYAIDEPNQAVREAIARAKGRLVYVR